MVVSHKYRFVFIEVPHTASHSISPELCEFYGGETIIRKHANLTQFMRQANADERSYYKFATVRNPLDAAVTDFFKLKGNHKGQYTNPDAFIENGGHVTTEHRRRFQFIKDNDADFAAFFKKFHNKIYNNWFLVGHAQFDFVIKFESLQQDYAEAVRRFGAELRRPLPHTNPTRMKKRHFLEFYSEDIREQAVRCYGPFMKKWGYPFPEDWGPVEIPPSSQRRFAILDGTVGAASRYLRLDPDDPRISRIKKMVDSLL